VLTLVFTSSDSIIFCQRCSALSASAPNSSTNRARLTTKSIAAFLTTAKGSSIFGEFAHADRGELGSVVVFGLIIVDFVDRNCGVYNRWLDSFLFHHRLNILMDMVVDMFPSNSWVCRRSMLSISNRASILELSLFGCKTFADVLIVAMLDIAVLYASNVVGMLFGKNLTVVDGLDRGMVVILVNLAINSSCGFLVLGTDNIFMLNGWIDFLRNSQYLELQELWKNILPREQWCRAFHP